MFRRLPQLQVGAGVIVRTDERQDLDRVAQTRVVEPREVSVMASTPTPVATLVTCVPDGVYTHRRIVTAELV